MTVTALNTQRHRYIPRGVQEELFYCKKPEVVLSGPAGTGKSRACLEKVHQCMLAYPGSRGLFIRKAREWLTSTALVTFNRDVIAADKRAGIVKWYGGSGQESAQYQYNNGSVIVVGGMKDDAQAGKVMSSEYDIIYVQEATQLEQDNWEDLTTRLRNGVAPYQQLVADCNPQYPTHWLKQRCDQGKAWMLNTVHEENPFLFDVHRDPWTGLDSYTPTDFGEDYIAKLDNLTGIKFQRLRKGIWAAAEGVIFEDWNPAIHIVEPFPIPDTWARYWSIDFGMVHPFVWQNWAEDGDGRLFLTQEIYRTNTIVEDHAREIKRMTEGQMKPQAIICDHDAEDRMTLERHLHLPTRPATKTVLDGIEAVQVRLRNRRLFLFRNACERRDQAQVDARLPTCTAEEIPGYTWLEPPSTAQPRTAMKEGPVKREDDGCDALRYVVADRDLGSRPRVSFI